LTDYPANVPQSERLETLLPLLPPLPLEVKTAVMVAVTTVYETEGVKIEMRNIQMMSEYDGRNMSRLCRKYRISRRSFYYIIHRELMRLRRAAKREP
jgi:Mor family transcriptional regulator